MIGISLNSQNFQEILFKTQIQSPPTKIVTPIVLSSFRDQTTKNNRIIIVSNGIVQTQIKPRRKHYVFSDDQIQKQSSQFNKFSRQRKHLIKKQKKEDPDYSVKRQKNDRNVVSNIIHHLIKHILVSVTAQQLQKIIQKKNIKIERGKFIKILKEKEKICKTYITNKHLKQLWNDNLQPQYSKLMRILSHLFLQNFSFLTIYNGNKINKDSKLIHYKGRRQLLQFLAKIK